MGYPHSITSEVTYRYPLHHTQTMIKILAIAGSLRKDSNSKAILKTLYACLSVIVPAPEVAIPKVQEKLKDSRLIDAGSLKMAAKAVDALIAWAGAHRREPTGK